MDGNGRWAKKRGLPRVMGHREGVKRVREVVTAARELGIEVLTLYAFSQENWRRPSAEVNALMNILQSYLVNQLNEMLSNSISLRAMGELDRLPRRVRRTLYETIERTSGNTEMILNLALSYSGRYEIASAARAIALDCREGRLDPSEIDEQLFSSYLFTADYPDPELVIRTSGEQRLSNFMLFQAAYSELYITQVLWPDFNRQEFVNALIDLQGRERRFGLTSEQLKPCTVSGS
jgi:undecaprenyl diphosphate synthase